MHPHVHLQADRDVDSRPAHESTSITHTHTHTHTHKACHSCVCGEVYLQPVVEVSGGLMLCCSARPLDTTWDMPGCAVSKPMP